jgi:phosphate transport system substrate-binding protein
LRRHVLALIAGLLAMPAGHAAAQGSITLRDRLVVVSSASSAGLTQMLIGSFLERHEGVQPPITNAVGSTHALELFCTGVGPQTPDLAIVTRRMPRSIEETCAANGVRDIIELQIGLGAVVVVARRGEVMPPLTTRQIWEALAAERPAEEEFVANAARLWSDVAPSLPRSEIRMILPRPGAGTRALFDDLILEAGCRHAKAVRLLFEASYRRGKCVTLRNDGQVTAVDSDQVAAAILAAPPGTLGVVSFDQMVASGAVEHVDRLARLRPGADLLPVRQAPAQPEPAGRRRGARHPRIPARGDERARRRAERVPRRRGARAPHARRARGAAPRRATPDPHVPLTRSPDRSPDP